MALSQETYRLAFPDRDEPGYAHVSYGIPFSESCAKHVSQTFDAKRAYVVASTSLSKQTSHVKDLEQALGDRLVGTWIGIRPHTPWDDLVPIVNDMRDKNADLLITLGGGSLTDGAKIIIYALANNVKTVADLDEMVAQTKADNDTKNEFRQRTNIGNDPTVPIICIPTTLSAGEYSKFGGGTSTITHQKTIMTHPKMFPSLVILDPALCTTTPEWVWLSTGIRAVDHCIESYCDPRCPRECEIAAEKSLKLLIPGLLKTKADATNLKARLDCQLAANYILCILFYAPELLLAGGSHGIGHQLGPLGVGHGQTSCILIPAVLKYNSPVNGDRQAKLNDVLWSDPAVRDILESAGLQQPSTAATTDQGGKGGGGSDLSALMDVVIRALGMPRTLKEVGVEGNEKLQIVAENSTRDPCCVVNPRPLKTPEQVWEVLEMVRG